MEDPNYKILGQLSEIGKFINQKEVIIENILKDLTSINYQIPANGFFKSKIPNWIGNTALHIALSKTDIELFNIILKRGADFTIKNNKGETVLHQAIEILFKNLTNFWDAKKNLDLSFIKSILSAHVTSGISVNPTNKYGLSHFHIACVMNDVEATEFFLKNGVSVNDAVSSDWPIFPGYTALHFAVTYHCEGIVELLLKNGADPNLVDTNGLSPLHLIIKRNMVIILKKRNSSDWVFGDLKKELELNERLINLILEKFGSNKWNSTDSIGLSRFHIVTTLQDTTLFKKALEEGADVNQAINENSPFLPGYTAVHFAAHYSTDTLKILLKNKCNITIKDAKGVTPFDICLKRWDGYFLSNLIMGQSAWRKVMFSNSDTRLVQFVEAATKKLMIKNFIRKPIHRQMDINAFLPFDSPIWPGYTLLHLAVVFIQKTDFSDSDSETFESDSSDHNGSRDVKIIQICLELDANVTKQDANGMTPLHLAFHMHKAMAVNEILKLYNTENISNPVDKNGLSHLHIACAAKYDYEDEVDDEVTEDIGEKLVKSMLENGVDPNIAMTSSVTWKNNNDEIVFLNVGWTPLHVAVALSNVRMIKILLQYGADIYAKDINGLTPIHLILCSFHSYKRIGQLLLDSDDLKDCIADCGLNHLHVACYVKHEEGVQKLLENGADTETVVRYTRPRMCKHDNCDNESEYSVNYRLYTYCDACDPSLEPLSFASPYTGCTPLHLALRKYCSSKITGSLVQHGANINTKILDETYPFYQTLDRDIFWWKESIIPELKTNESLQKCIENYTGITMLHINCAILDVDAVSELLSNGADVNAKVNMDSPLWAGCTPLHLLSHDHDYEDRRMNTFKGFQEIANMLLERDADVLSIDKEKNTPVLIAFNQFIRLFCYSLTDNEANPEFVAMLLKYQKDFTVNPVDVTGVSHFHLACLCGDVRAVEEFLKHGVDINSPVDYFSTDSVDRALVPLHFAIIGNSKEVVDLLLKNGADPNSSDHVGNTTLHIAVNFNLTNEGVLQSLMSAGADITAKNFDNETPMDLLFNENKNSQALDIFLKHGINVNIFDERTGQGNIACNVVSKITRKKAYEKRVYKAALLNPKVNDDDEMGRSPIHNILSTSKVMISSLEYAMAIEKYVKVEFDIDRRDKKGRTALHLAVQFKNPEGVAALLNNGSDINIFDNDYNTPCTLCFKYDQTSKKLEFETYKVLTLHIKKLQSFGLYVNRVNRNCDLAMCDQFPRIPKKCYTKEISELLKHQIDKSYPFVLLDFLSETNAVSKYPTMPRALRDAIDTFFENNSCKLREIYPNLACLLQLQYRKVQIRMTMIESAKAALNFISSFEIPELCSDIILIELGNEDLKNLIECASADWRPKKRIRLD